MKELRRDGRHLSAILEEQNHNARDGSFLIKKVKKPIGDPVSFKVLVILRKFIKDSKMKFKTDDVTPKQLD